MSPILLTKHSSAILGPIAELLGWIMDFIYSTMENLFGLEDVAISIILLTIFIYICLLPFTIKQQKYAKISQKMQPELNEIRERYKNKKDQESMMAMQRETSLLNSKYGVSPAGSCIQFLLQMPILFALYRVFNNVPAYITSISSQFKGVVNTIMSTSGYEKVMQTIMTDNKINTIRVNFEGATDPAKANYIIDILYKLPQSGWDKLAGYFPNTNIENDISNLTSHMDKFNYFVKLNISDTPLNIITTSFADKAWLILILALLVPVLSYVSQVANIKLMPQNNSGDEDKMGKQMKTMNTIMPLFSFIMCFSVPVGLGIYWIAGAVCRGIQQFVINKKFEDIDLEAIIKKNEEKTKKKREKLGIRENQIRQVAQMRTKKSGISEKASTTKSQSSNVNLDKQNSSNENPSNGNSSSGKTAKPGSMASKANLVRDFNERNSRK